MYWWWVWTVHNGRLVVFYPPYTTEEEARKYGSQHQQIDSTYEVTELNTRDRAEATRKIKRYRFDQTSDLDVALKRAKHESSENTEDTDSENTRFEVQKGEQANQWK